MEPSTFSIRFPVGQTPLPAENLKSVRKADVTTPAQPSLRTWHTKFHVVCLVFKPKTHQGPVDNRMRFPVLETYRLPPASIHGHQHRANSQLLVLQDFDCLSRRNWNVNFLTAQSRYQKGMVN